MKFRTLGAVVAIAAVVGLAGGQTADALPKRITVGSNPAGSVYFLLAGGFAKLFQEKLKVRATVQPHAGSSVYLPLMEKGEIVLGLNSTLDSGMALIGEKPFKSRHKKVRALARIWTLPYGYMVKANSGITRVEDLRGKRVIVHVKTNASLGRLNRTILATGGLTEKDIKSIDSGGVVAGLNMVVEGRADAANAVLGMPALRKVHAGTPGGMRVIALGAKASDAFMVKGMPGSRTLLVKPSKRLPFIQGETLIAAFDSFMNAGATVSAEDAYLYVKTLHANWKMLQKSYAPLRAIGVDNLAPASQALPYHSGAVKYWKEAGLWTAAHTAQQAKLLAQVR